MIKQTLSLFKVTVLKTQPLWKLFNNYFKKRICFVGKLYIRLAEKRLRRYYNVNYIQCNRF